MNTRAELPKVLATKSASGMVISFGWAYVDHDGRLKAHGQIPLEIRA